MKVPDRNIEAVETFDATEAMVPVEDIEAAEARIRAESQAEGPLPRL